jgi:hypothetical protein
MLRSIIPVLTAAVFLFWPVVDTHPSEINLPRSGQTTSYASGDDGAVLAGQPSPSPRFTTANGTISDNLTGLAWLQNANCTETVGGIGKAGGLLSWTNALAWTGGLASGQCGLADGSTAGQWRLPTRRELQSMTDESRANPAVPVGHPGNNIQNNGYWSSTTYADSPGYAWFISLVDGSVDYDSKTSNRYAWPVRDGE